ncbi:hypothetical protein HBH98_094870 [Parastagonospora nodorum]|nr:hypothetical protein HBI01_192960 [Parastagonospora nodorum]KAH4307420.1 hypothetical protein HBI02_109670 [Parastagonospora nodorum]KAH4322918.1 hypothetical protein HBI00_190590 [Parastagonospora nodorum]KAH4347550.1 hypothetical protein HBH98_094870 [Parastagonospora nodorum]KAH4359386.1 hypothetical protein HBH94_202770 [Parastagonospora nodorum]
MPTFLNLPTELRLHVYDSIIASTTKPVMPGKHPRLQIPAPPGAGPESFHLPTAPDLTCYAGFLLSSCTINAEFQAQWALVYNNHLSALITGTTFIKPMTKLTDSIHIKLERVDFVDVLCLIDYMPLMEFRLTDVRGNVAQYQIMLIWEQRLMQQKYYVKGALRSEDVGDGTLIVGVVWYGLAAKRRDKGLTWRGA